MDNTRRPGNAGAYVGAALLIVIGLIALVGNLGASKYIGDSIPLAIGITFLVAYAFTRTYGFLVPGAIVGGLGVGVLAASLVGTGGDAFPVLGLGLGFVLIFVLDMLVSRASKRWWPVIPGGILLLIGMGTFQASSGWLRIDIWFPVLLIGLGALLLIVRTRQPNS